MTRARAYWLLKPGDGAICDEALRSLRDNELLVQSIFGSISRGTEILVHRGLVPARVADEMRCPFQEGTFPAPVKYGYSTVGSVVGGPSEWKGRTVFCLYPHQDLFIVPLDAARPVPDSVPPERAVLAAYMETALNAVWDSGIGAVDDACIIGGGIVGLLTGYLVQRLVGARASIVDTDPDRNATATRLGMGFTVDAQRRRGAKIVIHASGNPEGLRTALAIAGFEGRIIELSWYGTRPVRLELGAEFHTRRLTLQSSQVSAVSPSRRSSWSHAERLDTALSLLDDPVLDCLFGGESRFEDLPGTMYDLDSGRLAALGHRIVYGGIQA